MRHRDHRFSARWVSRPAPGCDAHLTKKPFRAERRAGSGWLVRIVVARHRLGTSQERCQSGRMGRPAKALSVLKRTVGSNPTLSAISTVKILGLSHPIAFVPVGG